MEITFMNSVNRSVIWDCSREVSIRQERVYIVTVPT